MSIIGETWFPSVLTASVLNRFDYLLDPHSNLRKPLLTQTGFRKIFAAIDGTGLANFARDPIAGLIHATLNRLPKKYNDVDEVQVPQLNYDPASIGAKLANYDFTKPLEAQTFPETKGALDDLVDLAAVLALLKRMPDGTKNAFNETIHSLERIFIRMLNGFKEPWISGL